MNTLVSTAELAAQLGVTPAIVRDAVRQGRLTPAVRFNRKIMRFDVADSIRQLNAQSADTDLADLEKLAEEGE